MPSRRTFALSAVVAAACSGCADDGGSKPRTPPAPATAVAAAAIDAGVPVDAGVTTLPSFDPGSGYHLDDAPVTRPATGRTAARDRKPVQILLRSTPTGAIAAVDGVRLGPTPVLWEGVLDGQPREFTFVMAGHTLARYRFVPITGGIVHGSLTKLTEDRDAGTPAIPPVEPRPAGSVAAPPERPSPPPPPVDAAPPPPPVDAAPPPPVSVDAGASTGLGPTP